MQEEATDGGLFFLAFVKRHGFACFSAPFLQEAFLTISWMYGPYLIPEWPSFIQGGYAAMGSGSLNQLVAWGAGAVVLVILFIAVVDEKAKSKDSSHSRKKAHERKTAATASKSSDSAHHKNGTVSEAESEEAMRLLAHANAAKVLIPPPGEKRIEAVAPRNVGRTR